MERYQVFTSSHIHFQCFHDVDNIHRHVRDTDCKAMVL
jgi:hypothetical protein